MNLILFILDIVAVLGFATAFYYSLKLYKSDRFSSASVSIRSTALFTGVIWAVFLAFSSYTGYETIAEASSCLLAFMGGLFSALIIARMY